MQKNILKILVMVILTLTTFYSALADDNLLAASWSQGGNALTLTQGQTATINLEVMSGRNTVALQVRLLRTDGTLVRYLEENLPVYAEEIWQDDLEFSTSDLVSGDYEVEVEALNWNGATDEETLYLHINPAPTAEENHAPIFTIYPQPQRGDFGYYLEYTVGEPITIFVDGRDQDNDYLTYNREEMERQLPASLSTRFAPNGAQQNDVYISGRAEQAGISEVTITVSDGEESYSYDLVIAIQEAEENHAPTYTLTPDPISSAYGPYYEYDLDELILVFVDGRDEDKDYLTYNQEAIQSKLPPGLSTRFAPNGSQQNDLWIYGRAQEPGVFTVIITVSDGKLEYSYPLTFVIGGGVVSPENRAPVMNALADRIMNEGQQATVTATARDADNDALTYRVQLQRSFLGFPYYSSTLLAEMTFDQATGGFTFAPGFDFVNLAQQREVKLRFRAFDGEKYSHWENMVITINNVAVPGPIVGCMDSAADNYNPLAMVPGSCTYPPEDGRENICYDGLDNDQDQLVDCADPDCAHYVTCQERPEVELPYENVKIKSVQLSQEELFVGDYLGLNVYLFNNGDEEMKDLRVILTVPELNLRISGGEFDLDDEDSFSENLYFQIPEEALPGDYLLKITLQNSHFHESAYRQFTVR